MAITGDAVALPKPGRALKSARLLLRPLRVDDLAEMQRYAVDPAFWRWLPLPPLTAGAVAEFHAARMADADAPDRWLWAIEPLALQRICGTIELRTRDAANAAADMGWGLDAGQQGKGYMTEAAAMVLRFALSDDAGFERVWAVADVDNEASWRVMERIGMRREGTLRRHACRRGEWRDDHLYAAVRGDVLPAL
ncbi:GNAT family N-acetyltransferase [Caenispirillum bisanense]|uniref:GNAT family N-acetyltransferase n=1 Tax=Caenispirillum bisanense TaxID=414052 RepID=UPI0031DE2BA7